MTHPLRSTGITPLHHYYRAVRPSPAHRYFRPRGCSRLRLFLGITGQVLTFRTRARLSFAPPICRMPLGQSQCIPELIPEDGCPFECLMLLTLKQRFACARLSQSCLHSFDFSATFTTVAFDHSSCGGLRSTTDCRSRRALLHRQLRTAVWTGDTREPTATLRVRRSSSVCWVACSPLNCGHDARVADAEPLPVWK